MTKYHHVEDETVNEAVRDAVKAACESLDATFPGAEKGGITSNFACLLERVMKDMLQGKAPVVHKQVSLPQLVVDDSFFGPVLGDCGKMFLPIRVGYEQLGVKDGRYTRLGVEILALDPQHNIFRQIEKTEDCFTSYEAAVTALRKWVEQEGLSIEEVREMHFMIAAVDFGQLDDEGFKVKDWYMDNFVEPHLKSLGPQRSRASA